MGSRASCSGYQIFKSISLVGLILLRFASHRITVFRLVNSHFPARFHISTLFNTLASRLNECTCALCSSMATFIKKKKGGEKLLFEGYAYCVDRKSIERTT